ncbi:MAG: hypothetical protein QNJ12_22665 [Ilumatobacter sp.]|uniref:hypothetical protein n=1 Tax=Ilumatobacter sp. TaxID=1967498 RepID=UPI0026281A95|nr:hypothetical protein [Ilumatobacter sp.]MDJ0771606.1 hypothetical protein [Ilumatobacter sp.]
MTEHDPEWSRHHTTRAGEDFRDALWLRGFDHQSVWGYDTGVNSFFAQVWRNGSTPDQPDLWLTPPAFWTSWPRALVPLVVDFTEFPALDVVRAMGLARPHPLLDEEEDLFERRAGLARDAGHPYVDGQLSALDWVLGRAAHAPSSRTGVSRSSRPSAQEVDAEAAHATGSALLAGGASRAVGVEEALLSSMAE